MTHHDLPVVVVYTDDPDASVTRKITSQNGTDLTGTPKVAAGPDGYTITAEWLGDEGPERLIRVPVDDLDEGRYKLYLEVPGFNDLPLGEVLIVERD
jgi:hypothetical protein